MVRRGGGVCPVTGEMAKRENEGVIDRRSRAGPLAGTRKSAPIELIATAHCVYEKLEARGGRSRRHARAE